MTSAQTSDWDAAFQAPTTLSIHNSTYPFIDPAKYRGKLGGKTAIITGAGTGIGKETAKSLAAAGANVVLVGRRAKVINDVASEINGAQSGRALAVPGDVTDPQAINKIIAETIQRFGAIDILINNAGISRFSPFAEDDELEVHWRVFEVNIRGPMLFTHAVLRHMKPRGQGTIITTNTQVASVDMPYCISYSSSKAAMLKFNQNLSLELADSDIRVFSLHPGKVETEIATVAGAFGKAKDLSLPEVARFLQALGAMDTQTIDLPANTIVALCAEDDAKYLTGRYVDSLADLGEVLADAKLGNQSKIVKNKLYWQKMEEL